MDISAKRSSERSFKIGYADAEQLDLALIWLGVEGAISRVNTPAETLIGQHEPELLGKALNDIFQRDETSSLFELPGLGVSSKWPVQRRQDKV